MYRLLTEGIADKDVDVLEITKKLTIDGQTKNHQVYRIKLDVLYYNDKNGRISTWMSQHGSKDPSDREGYNDEIGKYIEESNPEALKKTKNNIKAFGQQEPGVVLNDGRIIDGNRRFTCLRELARDDSAFGYFEAVILDFDLERHSKRIKELELQLQHGKDKPVDYGAIEHLVEVYQDTVDPGTFTSKEYAKLTDSKLSEVERDMEKARLMVGFLDFIKAPKQFYIARDLKIDGTIHELNRILKKCKSVDEKENLKRIVFANIVMRPDGDMPRYVRKLDKIVSSPEVYDKFINKQTETTDKVIDLIDSYDKMNDEVIRKELRTNEAIQNELRLSLDEAVRKVDSISIINAPLAQIKEAKSILDDVDLLIIEKLERNQLKQVETELKGIDKRISEIRGAMDAQKSDP